jgi:hypothetical protein
MMTPTLDLRHRGRAWGKVRAVCVLDRYEAAIRLERARQRIRENTRYGFPVTLAHRTEVKDAEREYAAATTAAGH